MPTLKNNESSDMSNITCLYKNVVQVVQQAYACENGQAYDKEREKLSIDQSANEKYKRETPILHKPQFEL